MRRRRCEDPSTSRRAQWAKPRLLKSSSDRISSTEGVVAARSPPRRAIRLAAKLSIGLAPGRQTEILHDVPAEGRYPLSSAGISPALTNDDFPLPEAPTTTTIR